VNILPHSDKSIHSCQVEVSLLPLQCHIICVLVSSQVVFQRNRGVEMRWCVIRTVGWVLYHFPFLWWPHRFIRFCVVWCYKGGRNTLIFSLWDRLNKGKHWDFLVFHYNKLHCWSPRLQFHIIVSEDCSHDGTLHSWISSSFGMSCGTIL
jgi:hypothetical protein